MMVIKTHNSDGTSESLEIEWRLNPTASAKPRPLFLGAKASKTWCRERTSSTRVPRSLFHQSRLLLILEARSGPVKRPASASSMAYNKRNHPLDSGPSHEKPALVIISLEFLQFKWPPRVAEVISLNLPAFFHALLILHKFQRSKLIQTSGIRMPVRLGCGSSLNGNPMEEAVRLTQIPIESYTKQCPLTACPLIPEQNSSWSAFKCAREAVSTHNYNYLKTVGQLVLMRLGRQLGDGAGYEPE
ncbi:hypothetical protein B0H16DRAFT_1461210 [Mycena metata]|uniref:Uncharacterized protein n=1 Tax=Mycena metata TaxID=1033252 RepID=A0AAD7IV75_9AGAR|nr:hypothetical protein B0H16DRAFT_1461210 [Mycena metata]